MCAVLYKLFSLKLRLQHPTPPPTPLEGFLKVLSLLLKAGQGGTTFFTFFSS